MSLREKVLATVCDCGRPDCFERRLALAVARLVAEECAKECDGLRDVLTEGTAARTVAEVCASNVRQRAEELK